MELLPDFGTYLIDNQLDKPFTPHSAAPQMKYKRNRQKTVI